MKQILLSMIAISFAFSAQAAKMSANSLKIKAAAEAIGDVAASYNYYKVKPNKNVKAMLLEMGLKEGFVDNKEDFDGSWQGDSAYAWEADSTNWGTTDMKTAYRYVMSSKEEALENAGTSAAKKLIVAKYDAAKASFKTLIGTGVEFGVSPTGAVQCGVRLAALLIIDTESGMIYEITMEGSGC